VDLVPIKPIKNVITLVDDITTEKCRQDLRKELKNWKADVYGTVQRRQWLGPRARGSTLGVGAVPGHVAPPPQGPARWLAQHGYHVAAGCVHPVRADAQGAQARVRVPDGGRYGFWRRPRGRLARPPSRRARRLNVEPAGAGTFITKVFRSKDYNALLWVFNQLFKKVDVTKPSSSRCDTGPSVSSALHAHTALNEGVPER